MSGVGDGGGGGGGREEAGLVVAAPAPFPTQPLRFHLVFVTRFVFFCYCCTFTCAGAEKVRSFRALSITFGRIGTGHFIIFQRRAERGFQ